MCLNVAHICHAYSACPMPPFGQPKLVPLCLRGHDLCCVARHVRTCDTVATNWSQLHCTATVSHTYAGIQIRITAHAVMRISRIASRRSDLLWSAMGFEAALCTIPLCRQWVWFRYRAQAYGEAAARTQRLRRGSRGKPGHSSSASYSRYSARAICDVADTRVSRHESYSRGRVRPFWLKPTDMSLCWYWSVIS